MSRHVMYYALHAMLPESQQCHRRARTSYRLADLVTADRRTAASLAACAALCANRASCNSLSYRWSGVTIYSNIRGGPQPASAGYLVPIWQLASDIRSEKAINGKSINSHNGIF